MAHRARDPAQPTAGTRSGRGPDGVGMATVMWRCNARWRAGSYGTPSCQHCHTMRHHARPTVRSARGGRDRGCGLGRRGLAPGVPVAGAGSQRVERSARPLVAAQRKEAASRFPDSLATRPASSGSASGAGAASRSTIWSAAGGGITCLNTDDPAPGDQRGAADGGPPGQPDRRMAHLPPIRPGDRDGTRQIAQHERVKPIDLLPTRETDRGAARLVRMQDQHPQPSVTGKGGSPSRWVTNGEENCFWGRGRERRWGRVVNVVSTSATNSGRRASGLPFVARLALLESCRCPRCPL